MKTIYCLPLALALLFASALKAEQETVQTLPEVTVVSAPSSDLKAQREAATQKTILDRQAIEATGGLTVGEVLGKLPGVSAGTPSSDGSVSLSARGMTRDSVQVLVDGERPAGSSGLAMQILSRMPAGELERVEIMKGASAEFGGSAPLTINLVTNRAKRRDRLEIKAVTGARDGQPLAWLTLAKDGSSGNWSWNLPFSIDQTRTSIERQNTRKESSGGLRTLWQQDEEKGRNTYGEIYFAPKLSWKDGQSNFSIWPSLFRAKGERRIELERTQYADPVSGLGAQTVLNRDDREETRYWIKRLRLEGESWLRENRISGRLSLLNGHRENDNKRDSPHSIDRESVRRRDQEINSGLRLDRAWEEHQASLGLEYISLRRAVDQEYEGAYIDSGAFRAHERQGSLWVQDEWALNSRLTLTGGLRGEWIDLEAERVRQHHDGLYPSLAARWNLQGGWVLRLASGAQIKAPKPEDLSNAPVRSVSANSPLEPDQRGNPDLRPEKSLSLDTNLEYYAPDESLFVGFGVYARRSRDFVERRPVLEGSRWVERPYNEGEAHHWGVELDAKLKTDKLGLSGGGVRLHLTLPHARVEDKRLGFNRTARELPRYLFSLGYDQALPKLSSSVGFLWQQTGATHSDIPGEYWSETRKRVVVDAYWIRKLDQTLNLRLTLQNLLGEDHARSTQNRWGNQGWQLENRQHQPRVLMLAVEGKW
ncbi:MAG: TonB-dependent receptor [Zoogloeaceae bacterium]|nr:TonB-dependent receptor [Zoogloeaceae bacterium]